jgi:heat shock protein HtpX
MMRVLLFLATNAAVLIVASVTLSLLGFEGFLASNGVDLQLGSLLVFCGVFGMGGSLVSLFISKWMAKRTMGVQLIDSPQHPNDRWLLDTVAELSQSAGIGMPEVGVFQSDASNAFATGWNKNQALVAVSTGMLSRFSKDEIRAVLGHEIGHVANGDMITLSLIQGVVNTFVMFFARVIGHTIDRVVFKTERGHGIGFYIITFIAEIILAFVASMIVAYFSRWREYRADAAGAHLADRGSMINALKRLQQEQGQPSGMSDELVAFGIRSGVVSGLQALFSTHPPLEQRIQALQQNV